MGVLIGNTLHKVVALFCKRPLFSSSTTGLDVGGYHSSLDHDEVLLWVYETL